jgi:hypothetical protein
MGAVRYVTERPHQNSRSPRDQFATHFGIGFIVIVRWRYNFEHFTRRCIVYQHDLLVSIDHRRNVASRLFYMGFQYLVDLAFRQRSSFDRSYEVKSFGLVLVDLTPQSSTSLRSTSVVPLPASPILVGCFTGVGMSPGLRPWPAGAGGYRPRRLRSRSNSRSIR